ncbi:MAG: protein kinase domain-containing protein [Phycisphaerales bacterium]
MADDMVSRRDNPRGPEHEPTLSLLNADSGEWVPLDERTPVPQHARSTGQIARTHGTGPDPGRNSPLGEQRQKGRSANDPPSTRAADANDPDASKLPMPGDTGPLPMPDDTDAPLSSRADTLEILTGRASNSGGKPAQQPQHPAPGAGTPTPSGRNNDDQRRDSPTSDSSAHGSSPDAAPSMTMHHSGADTVLGRLVVEQGFATATEVDELLRARRAAAEEAKSGSLAQALVSGEFITRRQLDRLRSQVEAERSGEQLPGFQVIEKLGAGAMAVVYKAKQLSLDRMVAIKVLPRKFSSNKQFIERFYAEGRAAAQLNHPNVVAAYDVAQAGEFHYFVMEYVEGKTVHDYIVENKRFKESEALEIVLQVADALQHAHERGLIHRDVKPKNIMITPSGVTKLADLGLARALDDKEAALAEKGKAFGTPYYIAPEQIRGEVNIGPQADIYSLGATFYHMVTGTVPFNGKNPTEVMQQHLKNPLVPPDHVNSRLSAGVSEVIEMMMAKSRKQRYRNIGELMTDLKAVKRGEDPPLAHKESASTAFMAEMVKATGESPQQLVTDKSRPPSPFGDSRVQVMMTLLFLSLAWAVAATVVAAIQLAF